MGFLKENFMSRKEMLGSFLWNFDLITKIVWESLNADASVYEQ